MPTVWSLVFSAEYPGARKPRQGLASIGVWGESAHTPTLWNFNDLREEQAPPKYERAHTPKPLISLTWQNTVWKLFNAQSERCSGAMSILYQVASIHEGEHGLVRLVYLEVSCSGDHTWQVAVACLRLRAVGALFGPCCGYSIEYFLVQFVAVEAFLKIVPYRPEQDVIAPFQVDFLSGLGVVGFEKGKASFILVLVEPQD